MAANINRVVLVGNLTRDPELKSLPAILTRDEKGKEGPVNYAVRDGYIVLDSVPQQIILRSGREMTMLEHTGRAVAPGAAQGMPAAPSGMTGVREAGAMPPLPLAAANSPHN